MHADTCREAVKGADIILAATSSPEILLESAWVEKGTTVIALNGFIDVDPSLASQADKWVVGNRKTDQTEIIDSGIMSHGVKLDAGDIYGEIADIVTGALPGREFQDEIIVYTHMGSGAYDIACADFVYRKAVSEGQGTLLWLNERM